MGLVIFIYSLKLDVLQKGKKDNNSTLKKPRQTDGQTDRQADRQADRQTDRKAGTGKFTKLFNRTGGLIKSLNNTTIYQTLSFFL